VGDIFPICSAKLVGGNVFVCIFPRYEERVLCPELIFSTHFRKLLILMSGASLRLCFLVTIKLSTCLERKWSKRTLEPVLIFNFLNLEQVFACANIYCNAKKPYFFAWPFYAF
jgi:hypothetical protein